MEKTGPPAINTSICYIGTPCKKHGHKLRYIKGGGCVQCMDQANKTWHKNNRTSKQDRQKDWRSRNPEYATTYKQENRQELNQKHALHKTYNRGKYTAYENLRRARKLEATLDWLTDEHLQQIIEIYEDAAELSAMGYEDFHVDHIQPLQGKDRCGLHVPWNLQILSAQDNLKKSNKC